jgi:hypothetical protein
MKSRERRSRDSGCEVSGISGKDASQLKHKNDESGSIDGEDSGIVIMRCSQVSFHDVL